MAEYIEREAFLKGIEERSCLPCKEAGKDHNGCKCRACWVDDMLGEVIDAPAADVAPVVHGDWLLRHIGVGHYWECSACHTNPCIYVTEHTKFCPNCGARMDGDSDALD